MATKEEANPDQTNATNVREKVTWLAIAQPQILETKEAEIEEEVIANLANVSSVKEKATWLENAQMLNLEIKVKIELTDSKETNLNATMIEEIAHLAILRPNLFNQLMTLITESPGLT